MSGSVRAGASFEKISVRLEAAAFEDDARVPEIHYAMELPPAELEKLHWRDVADGSGARRSRFTVSGRVLGDGVELDRWEDVLELEELRGDAGGTPATGLSFQGRRLFPEGAQRLELTVVNEGRASGFGSVTPHRLVLARLVSDASAARAGLPFLVGGRLVSPLAGDVVTHPSLAVVQVDDEIGEIAWELERPREDGAEVLWSVREPVEGSLMAKQLPLQGRTGGFYRLRVTYSRGVEERTFLWKPEPEGPEAVRVLARERTPAEESRYRRRRTSSFSLRGERDRAIEEMSSAVSSTPGDAGLELELAALRYSARRYSEVVDQLEPLRFDRANEPDRFVLLAACSEALGRFDRAVELYERALALAPEDVRLKDSLARARAHARGR